MSIMDINVYLNIIWMFTTASIALGIVSTINGVWSDLFG